MKKLISAILIIILTLGVVACKKEKSTTQKAETEYTSYYILNKNTLVYHETYCSYLPKKENQKQITEDEIKPHYKPCGHCDP